MFFELLQQASTEIKSNAKVVSNSTKNQNSKELHECKHEGPCISPPLKTEVRKISARKCLCNKENWASLLFVYCR